MLHECSELWSYHEPGQASPAEFLQESLDPIAVAALPDAPGSDLQRQGRLALGQAHQDAP